MKKIVFLMLSVLVFTAAQAQFAGSNTSRQSARNASYDEHYQGCVMSLGAGLFDADINLGYRISRTFYIGLGGNLGINVLDDQGYLFAVPYLEVRGYIPGSMLFAGAEVGYGIPLMNEKDDDRGGINAGFKLGVAFSKSLSCSLGVNLQSWSYMHYQDRWKELGLIPKLNVTYNIPINLRANY